jgi:hypothetical protein
MAIKPVVSKVQPSKYMAVLTAKQLAKVKAANASGTPLAVYKCNMCGKYLLAPQSQTVGLGGLCAKHAQKNRTPAFMAKNLAKQTVAAVPAGYVKLASLKQPYKQAGVPISRLVNAIGGDRGLLPVMHAKIHVVYVKRVRWVTPWVATKTGMAFIMANCGKNTG